MSYDMIRPSDLEFLVAVDKEQFKKDRLELKKNRFKSAIKANKSILASDMEHNDIIDTVNRMIDIINEQNTRVKLRPFDKEQLDNGVVVGKSGRTLSLKSIVDRRIWKKYGIDNSNVMKYCNENGLFNSDIENIEGCDGTVASSQTNNKKSLEAIGDVNIGNGNSVNVSDNGNGNTVSVPEETAAAVMSAELACFDKFKTSKLGNITYKIIGNLNKEGINSYFESEDSISKTIPYKKLEELKAEVDKAKSNIKSSAKKMQEYSGKKTEQEINLYNRYEQLHKESTETYNRLKPEYDKLNEPAQKQRLRLNEFSHKSLTDLNYLPEDIEKTIGITLLLDNKDNVLASVLIFDENGKRVARKVYSKKDYVKDFVYKCFINKTKEWCKSNNIDSSSITEGITFGSEYGFKNISNISYRMYIIKDNDMNGKGEFFNKGAVEAFVKETGVNIDTNNLLGISSLFVTYDDKSELAAVLPIYDVDNHMEVKGEPVILINELDNNTKIIDVLKQLTEGLCWDTPHKIVKDEKGRERDVVDPDQPKTRRVSYPSIEDDDDDEDW